MLALLKSARNNYLERKGVKPLALPMYLQKYPEASPPIRSGRTGIAAGTVMAWYQWSKPSWCNDKQPTGWVNGWRVEGGLYQPFQQHIQALTTMVRESVIPAWETDIQQIGGFSDSKCKLEELESIDVMPTCKHREIAVEITEEGLKKNLAHAQIGIINSPTTTSDCFVRFSWDDLTYLFNSDGSHHFAEARLIAGKLGIKVPITGRLVTYELDRDSVIALRREFEIFAVKEKYWLHFFDAMRQFGAPFLKHNLPKPRHEDTCAVFLPKSIDRSMKAAGLLHGAGWTDLGRHLTDLCNAADSSPICHGCRCGKETLS